MCRGRLGRLVVVAAIAAALAALVRVLRGGPAPQFSNHPSVNGGPSATPDAEPVSGARQAVEPEPVIVPDPAVEPEPVIVSDPTVATGATPDADQTWVAPVEGACPPGHPIKAKLKSAIYHQPGGLAYDRTNPDRCYPDPEAAEADGFRAAKR